MIFLVALTSLVACNPCVSVCSELADYAEEGGLTVSSDEMATCKDRAAKVAETNGETCADVDAESLRDAWTCDDIAENFTNGTR